MRSSQIGSGRISSRVSTRATKPASMKQIAAGMTPADILKAYPELEAEDLRQAAEYAAWLAGEQARPLPTPEGR